MNKSNEKQTMSLQLGKNTTPEVLKSYFQKVFELKQSGNEFPVNLDEVWPLIYERRDRAILVLKSDFIEGEDYNLLQKGKVVKAKELVNGIKINAQISVPCLEYLVVRKVRPVFEVYRKVFHKVVNTTFPVNRNIAQITANITMRVIPSERHGFLVTTKELARAINVSAYTIRTHKSRGDFKLDVHFIDNFDVHDDESNLDIRCTVWTKKGVIKQSGHLRSGYSKELRDWAENQQTGNSTVLPAAQTPVKRKHNRITPERMLSIVAKVSKIEDSVLRESIIDELMGGYK